LQHQLDWFYQRPVLAVDKEIQEDSAKHADDERRENDLTEACRKNDVVRQLSEHGFPR